MPHQCVRCNTFYQDGDKAILHGCTKCGTKLFFFVKKEALEKAKEVNVSLSKNEKVQLEKDILELVGDEIEDNQPVILDFESIRCMQPGKYELDLVKLFKSDPLVYKLADGKYVIDLPKTFSMGKNIRKNRKK